MGLRTLLSQVRRTAETIPVAGCLPPWLAFTRGNHIHVDPVEGSDQGNNGSLYKPVKTLARALALAVANQNDIVFFHGRGNASARCTDYQNATLDWNKDLVHLIGINAGVSISQRCRVALLSSYDTASNLFTLSANGCYIANIEFFAGVAGTNPTGCMKVTGDRNMFENCHIAGIGHANNDIADAYDLKLDGADENLFKHCAIGLDSVARGTAANSCILLDGEVKRDLFEDCYIYGLTEHATNFVLVRTNDITAVDTSLGVVFKNCYFHLCSANAAVGATAIMKITSGLTGYIHIPGSHAFNDKSGTSFKWDVNDSNKIVSYGPPIPAADTNSQGYLV